MSNGPRSAAPPARCRRRGGRTRRRETARRAPTRRSPGDRTRPPDYGRGDVRRQRPGRRRPDDDRLALAVEEREADIERRVALLLVDARLGQLVLRERRAAAGAPLGRPVADVEPAALVDDLQEAPDVLDVRVAEGEIVVAPVHPLAEADAAARQLLRRLDHAPRGSGGRTPRGRTPRSPASNSGRAGARRRPRSTAPGSRSRSGSAGRSRASPCSAGRRP